MLPEPSRPPRDPARAGPGAGSGPLAALARRLLPYAVVAAGLVLVYAPFLRSPAMFLDDYGMISEPPPFEWILGATGRPVQYPLAVAANRLLGQSPGDPFALRAGLFVLWLALAFAVLAAVRRGLGGPGATAFVLFLFSVPAYLITYGWLACAVNLPGFLAAAAAYVTGYLWLGRARGAAARVALGAATVALVMVASLTYQVAAGLPLALVVYHQLFEDRGPGAVRRGLWATILVGAGLALSLVALRVILAVMGVPVFDRVQGVLSRFASLRGLLMPLRVFDENYALHYYYWGWLTREAAVLVGLALSVVVIRTIWREVRAANPAHRAHRARWAGIAAAWFLTSMLFALDGSRELRSKPFLTLLLLAVVVYALRETRVWAALRARRLAVPAVIVLVAATMWSGNRTLARGMVVYAEEELAVVRDTLSRTAPGSLSRVHVIQPVNRCYAPPCYGAFEFNIKLSSAEKWVPEGLVRFALAQLGRPGERPQITFSRELPVDPGAVVVDLDALGRRLLAEQGEVLDLDRYLRRRRETGRFPEVSVEGLWLRTWPAAAPAAPPG